MSEYSSNATASQLSKRILAAKRILITTHQKPDGDAIGATLALARGLKNQSRAVDLFLMGPVEQGLITIAGQTPFQLVEKGQPGDNYDLAIVVDTGAWTQLEPIAPWLKRHHDHVVGIDHHARGDSDVASMRWIDSKAVSTTAMLVPLFDEIKIAIDGKPGGVGEAIFVGLATDSGWFRYGNADAKAFELAARLLRCGVDKNRLYQILEETHKPVRLALEARALSSLEYVKNGSVAIQSLGMEDFAATGGAAEDLTGVVNMPMAVGQVRVSILFSQTSQGLTKISFRSKPAPPDGDAKDFTDVNELAARFGGGGHIHAAGARLKMELDDAKKIVIAALQTP